MRFDPAFDRLDYRTSAVLCRRNAMKAADEQIGATWLQLAEVYRLLALVDGQLTTPLIGGKQCVGFVQAETPAANTTGVQERSEGFGG